MQAPNKHQTWEQFWAEHERHLNLYGTAMVWVITNLQGQVCEQYIVDPRNAVPHAATAECPNGYYEVSVGDGKSVRISAEDIERTTKEIKRGTQSEAANG